MATTSKCKRCEYDSPPGSTECKRCGAPLVGAEGAELESSRDLAVDQPLGSPQMKPRSFIDVLRASCLYCVGLLYLVFYLTESDNRPQAIIGKAVFLGIASGLFVAYRYQGGTIIKESDDPKKVLRALAVRLAEKGYNLETQTESLHTFKPPLQHWPGGRVYILSEGPILSIVGPSYVLKDLRTA